MFSEKIIKVNFYLLLLLPIALITGPFFPDLIVILSCLSMFFFSSFLKIKNFNNKLVLMLLSLWLASIISSFFSTDFFFSIKSSFFYIRIIIFSLIVNEILKFYDKNLYKLLNILLLIFIFLFIDSCFQRYFGYNTFGIVMSNEVRVSSFFGKELILGSYFVKFYPIIIALLNLTKIKNFFLYFSGVTIITLITVILSAEKSAIAIFFIEFFFIIIFISKNFKSKILIIITIFLVFFIMFFSFPKIKNRIYDQLLLNSENFKYLYTITHTHHYISGYKIFIDNPIIGVGPKMFRKLCNKDEYKVSEHSCSTHPHNYSIQLLAETGIIGFSFFILFYFFLVIDLIKFLLNKKRNNFSFPLYSLLILNLINFMPLFPSGNFFNNWLSITYSFSFGLYLYFKEKYEKNE